MRTHFFTILCLATCTLATSAEAFNALTIANHIAAPAQQLQTPSPLKQALEAVAQLPGFEELPQEFLKKQYPAELGTVRGVAYGNADPREAVLNILDRIPRNLLYREVKDERGRSNRFYVGIRADGQAEMLYTFVGLGGNDLMVVLFSGASAEVYRKAASE